MKRFKIILIIGITALSAFFAACTRGEGVYRDTRVIMGTYVTITAVRDGLTDAQVRKAVNAGFTEITRVDGLMSTYKPQSQLSEVNRQAGIRPVKVDPEVLDVADDAIDTAKATDGAFDPTVGPLVKAWKIGGEGAHVPAQASINKARGLVGYRNVVIDRKDGTLFLVKKGMSLDFGGVAKGYSSDRAAEAMKREGVRGGIIAVAGDIKAFGERPDGRPWSVGVQHPRQEQSILTEVALKDEAISTSGDYERYFMLNGKRYHHILDPKTGYPAQGLISVTVVAKQSWLADSMSTGLFVLGPARARDLAERDPRIEVLFVDSQGKIFGTGRFRKNLPQNITIQN